MKLFTSKVQKEWDEFTIQHEPISPEKLMARAAGRIFERIINILSPDQKIIVLCGSGNNGGDGLVLATLFRNAFYKVDVWYFPISQQTGENQYYLDIIQKTEEIHITFLSPGDNIPASEEGTVFIDAITGYGFKNPWRHGWEKIIVQLNQIKNLKIAIDLPSGLDEKAENDPHHILQASRTYTIELPKKCFFYEKGSAAAGPWEVVPIGLHPTFYQNTPTDVFTIDANILHPFLRKRHPFSAKWSYGHAALISGNQRMPGAAMLANEACLRSGVGLLTSYVPASVSPQISARSPETLIQRSGAEHWSEPIKLDQKITAAGLGPGLGLDEQTRLQFRHFLEAHSDTQKIIDADGLNMLSDMQHDWRTLVGHAILTPHQRECERLFGPYGSWEELETMASETSRETNAIIILKGAFTRVCLPDGTMYYNTTGNPGMAKGGFGDILTGLLTGLLAQGYSRKEAALLGVYLHGLAGDLAAAEKSQTALLPTDLLHFIPAAWKTLEQSSDSNGKIT